MRYLLVALCVCVLTGCASINTQEPMEWRYWTATGDDGNVGQAAYYEMRYSDEPIDESNWDDATPVEGMPAPSMAGEPDSVLAPVPVSGIRYFRMIVCDDAGNCSGLSNQFKLDRVAPAAVTDLR